MSVHAFHQSKQMAQLRHSRPYNQHSSLAAGHTILIAYGIKEAPVRADAEEYIK